MNQDDDYSSESDQSDEDFCPDKVANNVDNLSEEESDDQISDTEATETVKTKLSKRAPKQGVNSLKKNTTKASDKIKDESEAKSKIRKTRQNGAEDVNHTSKSILDKQELESDEEDKSRTEALWADFLSDVKPAQRPDSKTNTSADNKKIDPNKSSKIISSNKLQTPETSTNSKKVLVTEIREFAGEEIKIEKIVNVDSIKENKKFAKAGVSGIGIGLKRPSTGGVGSILDRIGKTKKLSVLEKTKLDWNSFKSEEGLDEQLQTFNKGKDGYLERQDFLQRTDLRQFEIEKSLREKKRTQ